MSGHLTLLTTASGGDPLLLRALCLIEDRACAFSDSQLSALSALARVWARADATGEPEPAGHGVAAAPLTDRQREILALLSEGLTMQAIARRLCLSPRTVGKHLERMYRRLGTCDRLTTVLHAQRFGLLAAPPQPMAAR